MVTDGKAKPLSREDVARLAPGLGELKVARILETGATLGDLEEACELVAGDGEAIGGRRIDLTGAVAEIYDILTIEEAFEEDR